MSDQGFPLENVLAAENVGLRIGSPIGEPLVYLQFFFEDETGEEKRYSLRISIDQMGQIAGVYPKIRDEINMFASWDEQLEDNTQTEG